MGELYQAVCPCGYECHEFSVGCGLETHEAVGIYQCPRCNSLRTASGPSDSLRCHSCGSQELKPIDPEADRALRCPRCNQKRLRLFEVGLWD